MSIFRLATIEDVPALQALIRGSVSVLSAQYYTSKQIAGALSHVFGVDTQLILDGTCYTWHCPHSLSYHSHMTSTASQPKNGMDEFLNGFHQTIELAAARLLEIPEKQSAIPRSKGKWSPKEIIGHLIDSAANNHQRFVRAQFTDELVFAGYEQEEWVRVQDYQGEGWTELVQLWKLYNQHILHLVSLIPEEARTRLRSKHNLHQIASDAISENEPVTLDFFIRDYVDHMKKHLGQILG